MKFIHWILALSSVFLLVFFTAACGQAKSTTNSAVASGGDPNIDTAGSQTSIVQSNEQSEFYNNTDIVELKTFTVITGIPLEKVEESAEKTVYYYNITSDVNGSTYQYKEYLTSEYGFTKNDSQNKSVSLYSFDGITLAIEGESAESGVICKISIPVSSETLDKNIDAIYQQAYSLAQAKSYQEALDVLGQLGDTAASGNVDAIANYCKGMIAYEQHHVFASAVWYLENAQGVLDADQVKEEILEIIQPYNGIYYADHLTYPNQGIGYYIFIKDGNVAIEFESSYKEGEPVFYLYELMEREYLDSDGNSKTELMIGDYTSTGSIDIEKYAPNEDSYNYTFDETDDGKFMAIAYYTQNYATFNGLYSKVSDTPPESK